MTRKETIGRHIRSLRVSQGFGLREVAMEVKISAAYLSMIETGKEKIPSERVLYKLCALLGGNPDKFESLVARVPSDLKEYITTEPGVFKFLRVVRERGLSMEYLWALLCEAKK